MFILTHDEKLINTERVTAIYKDKSYSTAIDGGIYAISPESKEPIELAYFSKYEYCEIAFDELVETLKAQKEIFTFE